MMEIIKKKKKASVIENTLVMFVNLILVCAFLVIVFGAFSGVSDKWGMRQAAREYMLIMETEGYLKPSLSAIIVIACFGQILAQAEQPLQFDLS